MKCRWVGKKTCGKKRSVWHFLLSPIVCWSRSSKAVISYFVKRKEFCIGINYFKWKEWTHILFLGVVGQIAFIRTWLDTVGFVNICNQLLIQMHLSEWKSAPWSVSLSVLISLLYLFCMRFLKCKCAFFPSFSPTRAHSCEATLRKKETHKNRLPCVELFKLWAVGLMNYKSVSPFCWQNANLFMTLRLKENEIIIYFQTLMHCFRLGRIYLGWKHIQWINSLLEQLYGQNCRAFS